MTPSQWIYQMSVKKTPWDFISDEDKKTYLPFIINLWLSMVPEYIEFINHIQQYQVSNRDHYNFYLKILPNKNPYLRWVKGSKKVYSKEVIEKVAKYYSVGIKDIKDSLDLIDDDFVTNILTQMGIDNKKIKKMIK